MNMSSIRKSLIEEYGLQKVVEELLIKGWSHDKIAEYIRQTYGVEISGKAVGRYFAKHKNKLLHAIESDSEERDHMLEYFRKVVSQVETLNKEMWKLFNEIKSQKPDIRLVAVANQILRQLEFISKLLGGIKTAPHSTTVIQKKTQIINISGDINNLIQRLEELGYIVLKEEDFIAKANELGYIIKKRKKKKKILT